jgi:HTH-type transcriptional repressor of puuD
MSPSRQDFGRRIQSLRKRCGLSIRRAAELSGVTAGMISNIERGKNSPSIATLQKILAALGTDLRGFFGGEAQKQEGPVFLREKMKVITDGQRSYILVLPKSKDIHAEILDEHIYPSDKKSEFETLACDVAGYVLSGTLTLEIHRQPRAALRAGDGFYIPRGVKHRGSASGKEPVRLITVYSPPRY